jgi:hypothetical protein
MSSAMKQAKLCALRLVPDGGKAPSVISCSGRSEDGSRRSRVFRIIEGRIYGMTDLKDPSVFETDKIFNTNVHY